MNKDVSQWALYQSQRMRRLVGTLTLRDRVALAKSLRLAEKDATYKKLEKSIGYGIKQDFGQVARINFRFTKQGIWLEHGVGKGRPVRSSRANPKPWIAPVLSPAIDKLADLIAENYADIGAAEIKFFIPGIIDRRVKVNNNG